MFQRNGCIDSITKIRAVSTKILYTVVLKRLTSELKGREQN